MGAWGLRPPAGALLDTQHPVSLDRTSISHLLSKIALAVRSPVPLATSFQIGDFVES